MKEGCHKKKLTPRDLEDKNSIIKRINRIIGSANGVKKMIEEDRYCEDVLVQLAAIEKSIKSLSSLIMEEHLKSCVCEQIKNGNEQVVDEIMTLFKRFK